MQPESGRVKRIKTSEVLGLYQPAKHVFESIKQVLGFYPGNGPLIDLSALPCIPIYAPVPVLADPATRGWRVLPPVSGFFAARQQGAREFIGIVLAAPPTGSELLEMIFQKEVNPLIAGAMRYDKVGELIRLRSDFEYQGFLPGKTTTRTGVTRCLGLPYRSTGARSSSYSDRDRDVGGDDFSRMVR